MFIFSLCIVFISGHPKVNSQSESERLVAVNEYSLFCEINNLLIFENKIINNIHKSGNIYNYESDCNKKTTSNDLLRNNRIEYDLKYKNDCINKIEKKKISKTKMLLFQMFAEFIQSKRLKLKQNCL